LLLAAIAHGERFSQPEAALGKVPPLDQNGSGRPRAGHQVPVFRNEEPGERRPQVRVVPFEQFEPLSLPLARQLGLGPLGEDQEMLGVATPQLGSLIKLVQPFDRVLPDGLEHPETLRGVPEKALVNQRLQAVERDAGDLLCRLKREAGGKDGEAGNKCCSTAPSSSWLHSIVARSVCWRGSASLPL